MTPLGLEIRHLEMLEALLSESHVSRAADRLALSQPAVSNGLAQMRLHFRDELLVREGARMTLTPFAARLSGDVTAILRSIRALAAARPSFSAADTDRKFRIAMPPHVGALILPALVRQIMRDAPGAGVECQPLALAWKSFEAGELDLILCSRNMVPAGCLTVPVMEDHWRCMVSQSVPIHNGRLSQAEFAALRLILPTGELRRSMPPIGLEPTGSSSMPTELIPHVVAEARAAAVVPATFAQFHQLTLPLHSASLPFATPTIHCVLAWQANQDQDLANIWLREQIFRAAGPANQRLADLKGEAQPDPIANEA